MNIRRYTKKDAVQWNDFVRTSKNGFFMFDRAYMDYHEDRFEDHSLMIFDDKNKLIAIMPANIKNDVLYSHQGLTFGGLITGRKMRMPIMRNIFDDLKEYARAQKIKKIIYKIIPHIYHRQPSEEDLYALFRHDASQFRCDISSSIKMNGAQYSFSSSRKSGVNKAKKLGLKIEISDDYLSFFDMMNQTLKTKYDTTATHTTNEMITLSNSFPDNIKLYICKQENMLAGVIIYETDMVAHTQYIASSDEGKKVGATDLILDHLINEVYAQKPYFDFGISTEKNGQYLNEDLIDQKEGTGARGVVYQQFEIDI